MPIQINDGHSIASATTFAEIPESKDPVRVMKYYRSLWLAYQGLL